MYKVNFFSLIHLFIGLCCQTFAGPIVKALAFIVLLVCFIRPLSSIIVKALGFILLSSFIRPFWGIVIKALCFIFLLGCVYQIFAWPNR